MKNIYFDSFPASERRPWTSIEQLTQHSPIYSFYEISEIGSVAIGLITVWNLPEAFYIEHFAINPVCRNRGLGGQALDMLMQELGRSKPVVLEAELPGTSDLADRRIAFYQRHGFTAHREYDYVQPPYAEGLEPVPLMLMTRRERGENIDLEALKTSLHRQVYGK